jgi:hypothetical protein
MFDLASAWLSEHARIAIARRSIAEEQLRAVLRSPEKIADGNRPGRQVAQGTVTLGDPPLRVLLRVVVDLTSDPPEVVTAYATTQFKRYGAAR